MDDPLIIILLVAGCAMIVIVFVVCLIYVAKIGEWFTDWLESTRKTPKRRRVVLAVLLVPLLIFLGWWLQVMIAEHRAPQRMDDALTGFDKAIRDIEQTLETALYEHWLTWQSEEERSELRRSAIDSGPDAVEMFERLVKNSEDAAFRSDIAYILQEILGMDAGLSEGDVLSDDQLDDFAQRLRQKRGPPDKPDTRAQ